MDEGTKGLTTLFKPPNSWNLLRLRWVRDIYLGVKSRMFRCSAEIDHLTSDVLWSPFITTPLTKTDMFGGPPVVTRRERVCSSIPYTPAVIWPLIFIPVPCSFSKAKRTLLCYVGKCNSRLPLCNYVKCLLHHHPSSYKSYSQTSLQFLQISTQNSMGTRSPASISLRRAPSIHPP